MEHKQKNLPQLFAEAWQKFEEIGNSLELSQSTSFQDDVTKCYKILVQCTQMVNELSLFSCNETVEDLSTENIKYLLIPAFLSELSLKIISTDRCNIAENAKAYLLDFLERCYKYGIAEQDFSKDVQTSRGNHREIREQKVKRYKDNKLIKEKIKVVEERLKKDPDSVDESMLRLHYLNVVQYWINNSIESLALVQSEIDLLQHMRKVGHDKAVGNPERERQTLKPILITRDMLKNKVFGAGYSSLPTMSIEDFIVREFESCTVNTSLQKNCSDKNDNEKHDDDVDDDDEEDHDDDEKLKKARQWDDWKDTHRRGEGNKEGHG